jgi:hypothetical protein
MARINEMMAHRIAYPDRFGEKVLIGLQVSKKDDVYINGVRIDLPEECYTVKTNN